MSRPVLFMFVALAAGCGTRERISPGFPAGPLSSVPRAVALLRSHAEADIPSDEMAAFVGNDPPEELLVPLADGSLYIERVPGSVMFVLLGNDGSIQDTQSRVAFAFSVAWYQGLVVTLHHHPGTGLFYDQPLRVTVDKGKLVIENTEPAWPAVPIGEPN